jgi:hypothetical protein
MTDAHVVCYFWLCVSQGGGVLARGSAEAEAITKTALSALEVGVLTAPLHLCGLLFTPPPPPAARAVLVLLCMSFAGPLAGTSDESRG